jgi:hypothetical protein
MKKSWKLVCHVIISNIAIDSLMTLYTHKKENQIFLINKEIQSGSVAKLNMRNISPYMRRPLVMTLQLLHSKFPYIWGKFYFLFISVNIARNCHVIWKDFFESRLLPSSQIFGRMYVHCTYIVSIKCMMLKVCRSPTLGRHYYW